MRQFGIIGYPLSHSFSEKYFAEKFKREKILDVSYKAFPMESLNNFREFLNNNPDVCGLNVTIPHKINVIKKTEWLDTTARSIGAVNCLRITNESPVVAALSGELGIDGDNFKIEGFNTDAYGFEKSLKPLLKGKHKQALVLGDGGAAQAVKYVLSELNMPYQVVTRRKEEGRIQFGELNQDAIEAHQLIVNTTPLGTSPDVDTCPPIPYEFLGKDHLLYDLVYNPETTLFLKKGEEQGAAIKNGYEMLVLQAEKSWEIWNTQSLEA